MTRSAPFEFQDWVKLRPRIARELMRLTSAGGLSTPAALRQVFTSVFGPGRSQQEEVRFLLLAAPIARRIVIALASSGDRIGTTDIRVQDVHEWLGWLDRFDPRCARMIDLHYFAGLSIRQTAAALRLPTLTVIRELRFAKAWLQTKLL